MENISSFSINRCLSSELNTFENSMIELGSWTVHQIGAFGYIIYLLIQLENLVLSKLNLSETRVLPIIGSTMPRLEL